MPFVSVCVCVCVLVLVYCLRTRAGGPHAFMCTARRVGRRTFTGPPRPPAHSPEAGRPGMKETQRP